VLLLIYIWVSRIPVRGIKFLQIAGNYLPMDKASYPRRINLHEGRSRNLVTQPLTWSEVLRRWCQPEARISHTATKSTTATIKCVEEIGNVDGWFCHQNEWFCRRFSTIAKKLLLTSCPSVCPHASARLPLDGFL
jgi:hypothetical protein